MYNNSIFSKSSRQHQHQRYRYTQLHPSDAINTCSIDQPHDTTLTSNMAAYDQLNQNAAATSSLLDDYAFSSEKGQRIYGPPKDWAGEAPEHGCEVFIGHIPRDCLEHELMNVFAGVGRIYQFRLMMESPNCNRGFGFCCYTNKEDTRRAMEELNNFEIRPGKTIGVQLSVDNCKLFVGGIPTNKKRDEILDEMKKVTENVKDVIVYPSIEDKNKNRGFAFVEYNSHRAATIARQKLQKAPFKMWNKTCHVDWAEPEPQVSDEIMAKVTNLHARNLLDETTEDEIRRIFVEACGGDPSVVVKVRKLKDCAFIHFTDRESADRARTTLNNTCFDGGVEIEVNWAKPDQKKLSQDGKSSNSRLLMNNQQKLLHTDMLSAYELPSIYAQYPNFANSQLLAQALLGVNGIQSIDTWQNKNYRRNAAGNKTLIPSNNRKHPVEVRFLAAHITPGSLGAHDSDLVGRFQT
ncbi:APOB1 complementation factor [Cichlidogyrus casuarinus]|uniref:Probable RNA-binding protein 46 n=1 Tax=Cichlidogyrus casuarinus TaxID=1844966 RepID=A0ABD2Q9N8_9PLAT